MKKILLLCVLFVAFGMQAQTVNDVPLSELDAEYVMIVGTGKFLSNKVTVKLDFGQKTKYWSSKEQRLLDENGKKLELNSMIDALNFMNQFDYEFVNAYAITSDKDLSTQNVYHWILRKKRQ